MRRLALVRILLERTSRRESRPRRAVAASVAQRATAAGRALGKRLRHPFAHASPHLFPRSLEHRERRSPVDHAVTGVPERIDEETGPPCTTRVELFATVLAARRRNGTLGQRTARSRLP